MRDVKFRFWDPYQKRMSPDHRDATIWNGLLVCEGDTIPLQFTGLQDKNGRDIYEGDVVRAEYIFDSSGEDSHDFEVRAIEFEQGSFVVNDFLPSLLSTTLSCLLDDPDFIGFEVIGNIYETPDLVK